LQPRGPGPHRTPLRSARAFSARNEAAGARRRVSGRLAPRDGHQVPQRDEGACPRRDGGPRWGHGGHRPARAGRPHGAGHVRAQGHHRPAYREQGPQYDEVRGCRAQDRGQAPQGRAVLGPHGLRPHGEAQGGEAVHRGVPREGARLSQPNDVRRLARARPG